MSACRWGPTAAWCPSRSTTGLSCGAQRRKEGRVMPKDIELAWQHQSDSDLWGLLGSLFAAHPEWSAAECRDTLQDWTEARRREAWQATLLIAWPRWRRHHQELRNGLAQAGPMSWPQKCRYCEIWSANRPVMSPFCGI